jgi:hypothetical protein
MGRERLVAHSDGSVSIEKKKTLGSEERRDNQMIRSIEAKLGKSLKQPPQLKSTLLHVTLAENRFREKPRTAFPETGLLIALGGFRG